MFCESIHNQFEDVKTGVPVSLPPVSPASFEEFRAEKNKNNLPPPYTLEYVLSDDDDSLESSIEFEVDFESEIEQNVMSKNLQEEHSLQNVERKGVSCNDALSEKVDDSKYSLHNEKLNEKEDEINVIIESSHELDAVIVSKKNKGEVAHSQSEFFHADFQQADFHQAEFQQADFQQADFHQEEYDLNEISLEDLDNHYAGITANFSEVHLPFSEEAHSSIFPPQSKDLFLGQNENKEEREYQLIDWEAFVEYCISHDFPEEYMPYIRLSSAKINGDECILRISSSTALHQLNVVQKEVEKFLVSFLGRAVIIRYAADVYERRTLAEMMEAMHEHPQIKMLQKEFGANLLRCSCLKTEYKDK